jgi:LmbE family N-acetylglucosaminyl deacetylase
MGDDRPHFYHVCFPRSNFRVLWQEMLEAGITPPFAKEALDAIGSPDDYVTTVRDVSAYVEIKKDSLSRHKTQLDPSGPFNSLNQNFMDNWMSTEYFYLTTPNGGQAQTDILKEVL